MHSDGIDTTHATQCNLAPHQVRSSENEPDYSPPAPPPAVDKAARAEAAREKAQEKAEHDARVAEKEAALAHALQHAQEMKEAAAEKAAEEKIAAASLTTKIHPMYKTLIREYPFQPVRTDRGELVNIILVRALRRQTAELACLRIAAGGGKSFEIEISFLMLPLSMRMCLRLLRSHASVYKNCACVYVCTWCATLHRWHSASYLH